MKKNKVIGIEDIGVEFAADGNQLENLKAAEVSKFKIRLIVSAVIVLMLVCAPLVFSVERKTGVSIALLRGLLVFAASCVCAFGIAKPLALSLGKNFAAKKGILFKNAADFSELGRVDVIVFDKAGAETGERPEVSDVIPANGFTRDDLMDYAVALAGRSDHPITRAICDKDFLNTNIRISDFVAERDTGVKAFVAEGGKAVRIAGGTPYYIREKLEENLNSRKADEAARAGLEKILARAEAQAKELRNQGKKVLFFCKGGDFLGTIAVDDGVKADSTSEIAVFKSMGEKILVISEDKQNITILSEFAEAARIAKLTLKTISKNIVMIFAYDIILIPLTIFASLSGGLTASLLIAATAIVSVITAYINSLKIK